MGKKKQASLNNPDTQKELGNKAYMVKQYQEAYDYYSKAIELSKDKPSHVYFANRANASLEMKKFNDCITDCDAAIAIDPNYIKSYIRKAKAF